MNKLTVALLALSAALAAAQMPGSPQSAAGGHGKAFTPDKVQWQAGPASLPSGAKLAVLEGDPAQAGNFTMRLQLPDGYTIPPHWHPAWERITVISGSMQLGMGDKFDESKLNSYEPGSFMYMPPQMHHFARAGGETEIQLHGQGPWQINYLHPADDPRNQKSNTRR